MFGYRRHPAWDAEGCAACYAADDLADLEVMIPGIESSAGAYADVIRDVCTEWSAARERLRESGLAQPPPAPPAEKETSAIVLHPRADGSYGVDVGQGFITASLWQEHHT